MVTNRDHIMEIIKDEMVLSLTTEAEDLITTYQVITSLAILVQGQLNILSVKFVKEWAILLQIAFTRILRY